MSTWIGRRLLWCALVLMVAVAGLFQLYQAVAWLTTLGYLAGRREPQAASLVRDPVAVQGA